MDEDFKAFLLKKNISEEKYNGMTDELQVRLIEIFERSKTPQQAPVAPPQPGGSAVAPAGRGIRGWLWDNTLGLWFGPVVTPDLDAEVGAVVTPDLDAEVDKVLNCTVIIKAIKSGARGNGVVVTSTKLLTSLHGFFKQGDAFDIIDCHGTIRKGSVLRCWYSESTVDIAVLQINEGTQPFDSFVPVCKKAVKLGQRLLVISRRATGGENEYDNCLDECIVNTIVAGTTIFHSSYYSEVGMSGCGVVTSLSAGTPHALVVGVHVGSHDKTIPTPRLKRKRGRSKERHVTVQEFDDAMMSVDSNIHRHGAYSLICEACRVDGLLDLLLN